MKRYAYYTPVVNGQFRFRLGEQPAQQFVPITDFLLKAVKVHIYKTGDYDNDEITEIFVYIRDTYEATPNEFEPTGPDLAEGFIDGRNVINFTDANIFPDDCEWHEAVFSEPLIVEANVIYSLILSCPFAGYADYMHWTLRNPSTYYYGDFKLQNNFTNDYGLTWSEGNAAFSFETWGEPVVADGEDRDKSWIIPVAAGGLFILPLLFFAGKREKKSKR